jgi:hypothetical protein
VRLSRRLLISARLYPMTKGAGAAVVAQAHVREQYVVQMAFAEYHDMTQAFPADRSSPSCPASADSFSHT